MSGGKLYACICAIAKDEPDIKDWVDYHFAIGFDKIWIFDNNSKVGIAKLLAGYVQSGIVEVHDMPLEDSPQLSAYATFLKKFGEMAHWVAFIDVDEYINIKEDAEISEFLEEYEGYPAVGLSWKMFGSSGHMTKPEAPVMAAYTRCLGGHSLIKSIIKPSSVIKAVSPHNFEYKDGLLCVNEHCIPIIGPRSYHTSEKAQINHYYYKSQQDFEEKIKRGFATPINNRSGYEMAEFYNQAKGQGETETSILRFSKKCSLYSKMGPDFIANEVKKRIQFNLQQLLEDVSHTVIHGAVKEGIRKVKQALRYAQEPTLYASLSRLHVLQGEYDLAFRALSAGLAAARDKPLVRKGLFEELAALYEKTGLFEQKESILREINR